MTRVTAAFQIELPEIAARGAEVLAGEQSRCPFGKVAGDTAASRARHGARVEELAVTGRCCTDRPTADIDAVFPFLVAADAAQVQR